MLIRMKDQARGLADQFKNAPAVVVAAALILALGAFGVGLAAGNSDDSSDASDQGHGFHHRDGQGYGGPGHGGPMFKPDSQALEKFRKCMKDAGVDLPSPGNPPSQADRNKLRSAIEKCHKDLPMPGPQGRGDRGGGYGPPGGGPGGPPGGDGFRPY